MSAARLGIAERASSEAELNSAFASGAAPPADAMGMANAPDVGRRLAAADTLRAPVALAGALELRAKLNVADGGALALNNVLAIGASGRLELAPKSALRAAGVLLEV